MSLDAGTQVGRYEIEALLGRGGMGEVYRAFDAELGRRVALKFLHAEVAADVRRTRRFVQEARAASALNHPNIITVYDAGQTDDGTRFFATELVEGLTLRERMRARRLRLGEALDVAAQVADALVAAHAAAIIHRDVKPENIMLRPDGYVKVLDFGLAKLAEPHAAPVDADAPTRELPVRTSPGFLMGTIFYMSPEQSRGEEVDARTDVWSLGVVLYEMLTGRLPFRGKSASHTLVSIQEDEPPPLAAAGAGPGAELLQEVVSDALTKEREARPTASQMLARLRSLKRRLEAEGDDVPAAPPAGAKVGAVVSAGAPRAWRQKVAAAALTLAALGAAGYGFYRATYTPPPLPLAPLQDMKFVKLPVTVGQTVGAVISPDGKYVARVANKGGRQSLLLWQVSAEAEGNELASLTPGDYAGLTFSHDSETVYYVRGGTHGSLYSVPLIGGEAKFLISDVGGAVAVSHDGKRLAFKRLPPETPARPPPRDDDVGRQTAAGSERAAVRPADEDVGEQLLVADADGRGERVLVTRRGGIGSVAWSPDGRVIAYVSGRGEYERVEAVGAGDGAGRWVSPERWRVVGALAWLSDGVGLILAGQKSDSPGGEAGQLWYVAYPEGSAQKITSDPNNYVGVSLTADSRTALVVQDNRFSEVSLLQDGDDESARQLTTSGGYIAGLAWTPDGRLVYDSKKAGGNYDIWVADAGGAGRRRLTSGPEHDLAGAVSPDGRFVVYRSDRGAQTTLRRMDAGGGDVRELVSGLTSASPLHVSPDSRWVFYTSPDASGEVCLWRVPAEGGAPEKLRHGSGEHRLSPDGKWFVALEPAPNPLMPNAPRRVVVFPAGGGANVRSLDAPPGMAGVLDWSPDGHSVDYVATHGGAANVWRQPLSGGRPKPLTHWTGGARVSWFAWSRDGHTLAVVRDISSTDLVHIKGFR